MSTTSDRENYEATLNGLEDCRWQHMGVIADAARDCGDDVLEAGWRWLAKNKRWPEGPPAPAAGLLYRWHGRSDNILEENRPPSAAASHPEWLPVRVARAVEERLGGLSTTDLPRLMDVTARAVGEWLAEGGDRG